MPGSEAALSQTAAFYFTDLADSYAARTGRPDNVGVIGVALFREGVLQQSALDPVDTYCSPNKQFALLDQMLSIYRQGVKLLEFGVPVQELLRLPLLAEAQRLKGAYTNDQIDELHRFAQRADSEFERLRDEYARKGKAAV